MFPFQGGYELSFQYNDAGEQEQNNMNIEDLILLENHAKSAGVGGNMKRSRGRKSSSLATNSSSHNVNNDDYEKKIIHREVERQRRHEMSNLYTSLRSVLPAESIKGKRSISDHVGEAMNYIKKLEKNVKELGEKRDELRINSQEMITSSRHEVCGSSNFLPGNVAIQQVLGGLQIDINVSYEDERFSLATALQVVLEEGLSVASCSSTRIINGTLVHNMLCEVSDITCIDVNRLQQRLIELVY